jgi:hypothetical protein
MARSRWAQGVAGAIVMAIGLGGGAAGCFSPRKYPGPAPCKSVADCDDHNVCTTDFCGADGACDHTFVTPPASALDDGDQCTEDACAGGVEKHTRVAAMTGCGAMDAGLSCDASGNCVTCMDAGACGAGTECLKWTCVGGACKGAPQPAGTACGSQGTCDGKGRCTACNDKVQDGGETDVDCGGPCATQHKQPCSAGQHCDADTDCNGPNHCEGGVCCNGSNCPVTP